MANEIKIVDGSYAVLRAEQVIGVVERMSDTQWAFRAIVPGISSGATSYIPLSYALEEARKFQPN